MMVTPTVAMRTPGKEPLTSAIPQPKMNPSSTSLEDPSKPSPPWQATGPPQDATLPSTTLSNSILKHITKLLNSSDASDDSTSREEYYTRVVSAIFLSNVHYLLYARGLIHTHIGHLVRESSTIGARPTARSKKREKFLDSLRLLEEHVQGAVGEIRRSVTTTSSTATVPMALVLGPSPLSPRRIYYVEQRVCGMDTDVSGSTCTPHSLLPTYIRSSLNLTLNRFLISTALQDEDNNGGACKRGTKMFVFLLQPVDWQCSGWHKRNGVRLDLSSLAECQQDQTMTSRETTPASLLDDSSRSPSPVPLSSRIPPPPETPKRKEVLQVRPQETPRRVLSLMNSDPRPPGSRLMLGNSSTTRRGFTLKPHAQASSQTPALSTSLSCKPKRGRNRTTVVGYRIDSGGEAEMVEESGGKHTHSPLMAWFQCETVIGGFV